MTEINFISALLLSFGLSVSLTFLIRKFALRHAIIDQPDSDRKIHQQGRPLLGGLAIYLAVAVAILIFATVSNRLIGGYLLPKHLIGLLVGGLVLMIGGFLDDRYHLLPSRQIIFPLIACLVIIASGIGVNYITNPLGEALRLDTIKITLFHWGGLPYAITLWSDLFTLVWLMGLMYTTKFLDGLDGLSSGVATIGSFIIFILSLTSEVAQPETALLAFIFTGAGLGFLIWNFYPARIFLGEGGSVFVGFFLGVLAIISGAKVATALLIMGIPILDAVWVIGRRIFWEKKSPTQADKKHLHFRLLDVGLTHRQAVIFLYLLTTIFGLSSLFLTGQGKVLTMILLSGVMVILAIILVVAYRRKRLASQSIDKQST